MSHDVARAAQRACWKRALSIPHDSDDVAQDVLLELLAPPEGDIPPDSYASFRYAATRKAGKFASKCLSARRPKWLSRTPLGMEVAEAAQPAADWHREYIDALPDDRLKQVFRACFVEGDTQTEAAQRLDLTRNMVFCALERIRRELKQRFAKARPTGVPQ
jgi:DNA-directed RNA polymerase specialized sigma24 family protein